MKVVLSESVTGMSNIMFSIYFQYASLCSFWIFYFKDLVMLFFFRPDFFLQFCIFFFSCLSLPQIGHL